jgi:lipid A 3-O-deacylase
MKTRWGGWIAVVLCLAPSCSRGAQGLLENWGAVLRGEVPHERALGVYAGTAYDWSHTSVALVSAQALFDYEDIWLHRAPEGLGIRFEANVGAATGTEFSGPRFVASGHLMAVYDLRAVDLGEWRPYVEAGIGLIYTDFQRAGQGLRLNFNPVAGVGVRLRSSFITLRLDHVSNGGLDDDNRGINSVFVGWGLVLGSGHRVRKEG